MAASVVVMVYFVGNNDWEYIQQVDDAVEDDIDRTLFIGGVLYSHAYKGEHPERDVEAVEKNRMTAFFQEFIAEQLEDGKSPEDVLQNTFLASKSDNARPEDWETRGGGTMFVPHDDIEAIKGEYEDFVEQNDRYTQEDLAYVTGQNPIDNLFGRFDDVDDDLKDGDGQKQYVDLYELEHQRDTYLDIVNDISEIAKPDNIQINDISDAENDADMIYTNNVIDWFDEPEQFFQAVDNAGSEDGYYLEIYTTGTSYGTERFNNPDDVRELAEDATGRTAEVIETDVQSKIYEVTDHGDTEREHASYHTQPIEDGENHVLLYIE